MQEVVVKLQFNQPCLGDVRKEKRSEMLKDPRGRAMLLPTWWKSVASFAARLLNRHQELVTRVDWDPVVEEPVKEFRRYYGPGKFTVHEAFLAGDVIVVRAVLPDGLPVEDFREIMATAGRYKGICPYKPENKMGTFEVLEVRPAGRPPAIVGMADA